jgi:hypothetical protein
MRAAPAAPPRQPLYARNPLLFWQVACALLAVALIASLAWHAASRAPPGAGRTITLPR